MTGVGTAADRDSWDVPGAGARFPVLLAQNGGESRDTKTVIALAGGQVARQVGWADIAEACAARDDAVVVLDAYGVPDERIAATLDALAEHDAAIVAAFASDQIDVVAAGLIGRRAHLLCEPTTGDWLTALFSARGTGATAVVREDDADRIAQLNAEIARLAELLARFTQRETDAIADRRLTFSPQPAGTQPIRAEAIRKAIRARRQRDRFFGAGLFEDPAWDMLLDLFAARIEGIQVSVSSLCIAAAVAPTTALRWIGRLTDAGLFARHADPRDRRRAHIALSPEAVNAMHGYLAALREAGMPFA